MQADASYMSLGWWLTEGADGALTPEVAAWSSQDYGEDKTLPTVGKATFAGIAVGKYSHKTINDIYGGHFNADAELVATFASGGTTITGTIDNFMSDGESTGDGWKVDLASAADPNTGASIAANTDVENVVGARATFGDQKTMGVWNAEFVGNSRNDNMPEGVVGTFAIGESSHPVNMVGAFAASNQEADQPRQ